MLKTPCGAIITAVRPDGIYISQAPHGAWDAIFVYWPGHTYFGGAVAAPSANRFGQVSPTSAAHVRRDLAGLLAADTDVIVDGGECQVGVESTIVDATGPAPATSLKESLGPVVITR